MEKKQLQELKEMTKIVISQRTASLKRCDRIMVLYHGELVGFDCHEELLKNCTVYKEIYEVTNHSATEFAATGCYSNKQRKMLYSVVSSSEAKVLHIVNLIVF